MHLYSRAPRDPDANARTLWNFEVMHHFGGGEDDPICTIDDPSDIAAAISQPLVRFERFPSCGHGVYHDDPQRAFAVLREFLTS